MPTLQELRTSKRPGTEETPGFSMLKRLRDAETGKTDAEVNPHIAEAASGQATPMADPYAIRQAQVLQEFDKLPWYSKASTAADDLARLAASGISYGALDKALGPDQQRLTEEARMRAGWAGVPVEIGGAIASPITRTVGAGANMLRGGNSALNMLISGGEGGLLSALQSAMSDGNVAEDAKQGAALSAGLEGLFKHILPGVGKYGVSLLTKVSPTAYSDAFKLGEASPQASRAFRDVQRDQQPTSMLDLIAKQRRDIRDIPLPPDKAGQVDQALIDVLDETTSLNNTSMLDNFDELTVKRLQNDFYDTKTGNRKVNDLGSLVGYLEKNKLKPATNKSEGGRYVKKVREAAKQAGIETDPRFSELLKNMDLRELAYATGKKLEKAPPSVMASVPTVAGLLGAGANLLSGGGLLPVIAALTGASIAASSPRLSGRVANLSGAAKRRLRKAAKATTGVDPSYGTLGIIPGMSNKPEEVFMEDAKGNKYDKRGRLLK